MRTYKTVLTLAMLCVTVCLHGGIAEAKNRNHQNGPGMYHGCRQHHHGRDENDYTCYVNGNRYTVKVWQQYKEDKIKKIDPPHGEYYRNHFIRMIPELWEHELERRGQQRLQSPQDCFENQYGDLYCRQ